MDLRVQKTRSSIINAFIQLRSQKPIEKITVTELSNLAMINKATFYKHYKDIYDLSESLENELIASTLQSIPDLEKCLSDPYELSKGIFHAILSQSRLLSILFSGSRATYLIQQLELQIREMVFEKHPEYRGNLEKEIQLTYIIQGGFYSFLKYRQTNDEETIIDFIIHMAKTIMESSSATVVPE